MTRGKKIFIGLLVLLLILLVITGIIYFTSLNNQVEQPAEPIQNPDELFEEPEAPVTIIDGEEVVDSRSAPIEIGNVPEVSPSDASLKAVALSFAERFGSFSNQSNFENIVELQPFMTERMQVWANNYVAEQRAQLDPQAEYYGVTTRVLSSTIVDEGEEGNTARVDLYTQRIEYRGASRQSSVSYQRIILTLENREGTWLVDDALWQ